MCTSLKEVTTSTKSTASPVTTTTTMAKSTIGRTLSQVSTTANGAGCIQTRYIILLLCCLTNAISYTMRLDLNMTIVAMVKEEMPIGNGTDFDTCPSNEVVSGGLSNFSKVLTSTVSSVRPTFLRLFENDEGFDWSESLVGVILGAFYYGYILTMAYGGQLADFIGTKLLVAISMTACALGTLAIPVSAYLHPSLVITVRIMTGLAQGVVTPALYTILPKWMPSSELGLAFGLIVASGNLGAVLTMPICGFLSEYASWPWVFYLFGSVALLFTLPWLYLIYNEPQLHPRISAVERVYITSNLSISSSSSNKQKALVPWKSILTSPKIWAIAVTRFCNGWGSLFLISKLPSYLSKVLHMPMTYNGYVNASIYITLGASSLFWGYVSDVVGRKQLLSKTVSRKMFQSIALLGGAFFLALIPVAGCNIAAIIALLNLSMLIIGLTAGGEFLIVVDVAPNYSGSIYGFTNAIASLPGFLAPLFVGLMLDQPNVNPMKQWNILFGIAAAIYTFGAVVFLFAVNSEPEKWGRAMSMSGNQEQSTVEKPSKGDLGKSGSISSHQVNTEFNKNTTSTTIENMA